MKKTKRWLSAVLSLAFSFGALPVLSTNAVDETSFVTDFNEASYTVMSATDERFVTFGRVMEINGLPAYSGGASGFSVSFTGTCLYVNLAEATGTDFVFILDGQDADKATRYKTTGGTGWIRVATGLTNTTHNIRFVQRDTGRWFSVDKVATDGTFTAAPAITGPTIEVYGDSITEGACTFEGIYSETYGGYGYEMGRLLNADTRIAAISGGGITENADGNCTFWDTSNPRRFYHTFNVSASSLGAYTRTAPDAVVINVGTNDNNHINDDDNYTLDDYVNTYLTWLDEIHTDYPEAKVVCVLGAVRDDRPNIDTMISRLQTDVVDEANRRAGEVYVYYMEQVNCNGYEELGRTWDNLHPNYSTQKYYGLQLAHYLNDLLDLGVTLEEMPTITAKPPKIVINEDDVAQMNGVAFTSSSDYNTDKSASMAFDGDNYSYWQASSGDCWVAVEFDKTYTLGSAYVDWNTISAAGTSKIEVSTDGTTWTTAAEFTATEDEDLITFATPVEARYMRLHIYATTSDKGYWPEVITLSAFEVSGTEASLPGDVNGDEEVDATDLTSLARHVGGIGTITGETLLANADVNDDGAIDAGDLTALARKVGGID